MTRTRKIVGGVIAVFLLALIAVIVLITTGVIGFHEDDDKAFEKPEIKPGKYYLELENGYAQDEYIEVFSDQTIEFVGDYWDAQAEKDKETAQDPGTSASRIPCSFLPHGIISSQSLISSSMRKTDMLQLA